ncbi:MAG: hypothetical protein Q8N42_01770 [bacterium]|nr:hypothetical protein [bacterium]
MTSRRGSILIGVIIIIVCCGIAYVFDFKPLFPNPFSPSTLAPAPAMPEAKIEAKSEPAIKSPVLEEALRLQKEWDKVRILLEKLQQKDIEVLVSIESKKAEVFLEQLLADEDSQKTFRYFSKRKIVIYLSTRYRVSEGCVYINSADGVKKTAEWLVKGKI